MDDTRRRNAKQKSETIIRNAHANDVGTVKNLYAQLSPDIANLDEDFPQLIADPNARCLLLEKQGKPIGMVICYVRSSLSSGKKMVIEDLVIDSKHRMRLYSLVMKHSQAVRSYTHMRCLQAEDIIGFYTSMAYSR